MPYKYEINGQTVEFDKEPSEQDIDEAAGSLTQSKGNTSLAEIDDKAKTFLTQIIGQLGKGAYENKLLNKIAKPVGQISQALGGASPEQQYAQLGQPQGTAQQVANMAGNIAPDIAMATPFLRGAGMIPGIARSGIATGAVGLGVYGGTRAAVTGENIPQGIEQGAISGAMFGAGSKLGASLIPKSIPGAERIGSSLGAGLIGSAISEDDEKASNFLFNAGLAALTPTERYNFKEAASRHFDKIVDLGEKVMNIAPEDTKVWKEFSPEDIIKTGENPATIQDSLNTLSKIPQAKRQILSKFYDKVKYQNSKPFDAEELSGLLGNLQKYTSENIHDKTSNIPKILDEGIGKILGVELTFDTSGEAHAQPKELEGKFGSGSNKEDLRNLPDKIRKQVIEQLQKQMNKDKLSQGLTLDNLHNLANFMEDTIRPSSYKNKNFNNDERVAFNVGKQIRDYIGNINPYYKMVSNQWHKMKNIEGSIQDLSLSDLQKSWNTLDPNNQASKYAVKKNLADIESYARINKLGQYQVSDTLRKYFAFQKWNNINPASFRSGMPMRIAFETIGAGLGGILGSFLGVGGALGAGYMGRRIASAKAIKYLRPQSWIPVLKMVNAQTAPIKGGEALHSAESAAHGLELIKMLASGE